MKSPSDHICDLCAEGDEILAVADAIMFIEEWRRDGMDFIIEAFISNLDLTKITPAVMIGILTVTKHIQDDKEFGRPIHSRARFLEQAEKLMKEQLGEERTEKLLELRR
jgi:hypothetical protein